MGKNAHKVSAGLHVNSYRLLHLLFHVNASQDMVFGKHIMLQFRSYVKKLTRRVIGKEEAQFTMKGLRHILRF